MAARAALGVDQELCASVKVRPLRSALVTSARDPELKGRADGSVFLFF
jgi:hypothetical protein